MFQDKNYSTVEVEEILRDKQVPDYREVLLVRGDKAMARGKCVDGDFCRSSR
jgi:hypothetical protein